MGSVELEALAGAVLAAFGAVMIARVIVGLVFHG